MHYAICVVMNRLAFRRLRQALVRGIAGTLSQLESLEATRDVGHKGSLIAIRTDGVFQPVSANGENQGDFPSSL